MCVMMWVCLFPCDVDVNVWAILNSGPFSPRKTLDQMRLTEYLQTQYAINPLYIFLALSVLFLRKHLKREVLPELNSSSNFQERRPPFAQFVNFSRGFGWAFGRRRLVAFQRNHPETTHRRMVWGTSHFFEFLESKSFLGRPFLW